MLEEGLKPILGEYSERGFELSEINDHTLQLSFQGETISIIGTLGLGDERRLVERVRDLCREHLELLARAKNSLKEPKTTPAIPAPTLRLNQSDPLRHN
jgi:hypothetical protein